jgi:peroxiredoxin
MNTPRLTASALAASLAAAGLISACTPESAPPSPARETAAEPTLATGTWRAEIEQNGRSLPFTFEVEQAPGGYAVTYLNGPERMPVEEVKLAPAGQLELNFPSYSSGLTATVDGKRMTGEIRLARKSKTYRLPFTAVHDADYRFFPEPAAEYADLAGRWEVEVYVPAFDFRQPAIGLFQQDGNTLSGTVQTQVGDYRYLAGEVRGNALYLSAFDGGGTQLWLAELQEDGTLSGTFDSVTYGAAEWTARRNDDIRLEDATTLTYLRDGYDRIAFSLPDLDGNVVSLDDPRFEGKVVLVVLGGTWCPTCHDEAVFMEPLEAEFADRGLEVVDIMFEYSNDFAEAEPQLTAFRDRYRIEHPILFAGDSSRETRGEKLPMLNDIMAFPTTIFIDRQGQVRRIHTAFPGPATGQEHEDYKREFRAFVEKLLSEPA